jgi:serine phosphatase RsbU (regulator of sigma subunit)
LHTFAPGYQTLLSFPMSVNGSDSGRIVLLKEQVDAFDAHEIRVLGTFVNQARLAIEKNRLVEDAVETERMRNDFEIAKKVQTALLPREVPTREWIDLCVEYSPAAEVGGDYYDFFEDGERIRAVIGDVSGKGMGAAFNVAELKGIFHSHRRLMTNPVEFLAETNTAVSACFDQGVFLTMIFLNFVPEMNEFVYARAGHCPILHYQAHTKSAVYLEDSGLGLGILRNDSYRKHVQVNHRRYEANDLIILFTDGVFESVNAAGEEYGLERLREVVARHGYFTAMEVKEKILQDVREFCVGGHVVDDITLMVIKFK